jgi:hypothetical protein
LFSRYHGILAEVKLPEREAVKGTLNCAFAVPYICVVWCSVVHKENLTLVFNTQ